MTETGFVYTEMEWINIFNSHLKPQKNLNLNDCNSRFYIEFYQRMISFFILNIIDLPAFSFCNQDIETKEHLFVDCFHVKEIR